MHLPYILPNEYTGTSQIMSVYTACDQHVKLIKAILLITEMKVWFLFENIHFLCHIGSKNTLTEFRDTLLTTRE